MRPSSIVLYVLPGQWGLPSIDPSCLAAIIFLQLTVPGKFCISDCSNPDASPTGQLPFLTHDRHVVVLLPSIIKYVSNLDGRKGGEFTGTDLDQDLSNSHKSQRIAWSAHVEAHLGDLVYYMLYSVPSNWVKMTSQVLSSMFPLPHRYYVPTRIREIYKPRLETSGLWSVPEVEKEPKNPFQQTSSGIEKVANTNIFQQAFEKEKAVEKAKAIFDIYARLLKTTYFSGRVRPSSLDAIVSAHVLLLLNPPYPAPVIQQLLLESYPSLVTHARLMFSQTLDSTAPTISKSAPQGVSWRDALSMPWATKRPAKSAEEIRYDRLRWSFFGLVVGCIVAYLAVLGRDVRIQFVRDEDEDEDGELEVGEEGEDESIYAFAMDDDVIVVDDVEVQLAAIVRPSEPSSQTVPRLRSASHPQQDADRPTRSVHAKPKIPPKLKLKLGEKAASQAPGMSFLGQYDRELDSSDDDLSFEEQFILRLPPGENLEKFRKMVAAREVANDIWFKFKDSRRAVFHIGNNLYSAKLVDLPCIIESQKTLDNKQMFKAADICQMLVVEDKIEREEPTTSKNFNFEDFIWPHGITPPLHRVRKRRFRKRVNRRTIESVEQEVERLLYEDSLATEVKFDVLENVNPDLSDSEFIEKEGALDAPTPALSDMGDAATPGFEGGEGEQDEEEEGDIDEELAAELDQALVDEDEMGRYGADEEEEDEDDESEDEDEDEDDELVQARKLLSEEIRDLEAAVAKKNHEIASSANPLIRKRFEDALKKLTADLEMKIAQRDELKEKQRLQKEGVPIGEADDTDQDGPINDEAGDNLFGSDDPSMSMDIG
ncbi:hypothetical protein AX15_006265 [Amanita polypyramis BW_CC]|nr:hypothetical protein AX15_006265 [Amanita polypyramis BW_CC]